MSGQWVGRMFTAEGLLLELTLKHIGRFSGWRCSEPRCGHVPQKSLFLVGRALEPSNPASGECNLCHVEPLAVLHHQDVRAEVSRFTENQSTQRNDELSKNHRKLLLYIDKK